MKEKKSIDIKDESSNRSAAMSFDRFVPYSMLKLLGKDDVSKIELGDQVEKELTILFADIRDFTSLSETLSPKENFDFINSYLTQMDQVISKYSGIIDKFLGDGIMAIFPTNSDTALTCSVLMLEQLEKFNLERKAFNEPPIRIGIGLNTGLCMLGTVGGPSKMECTVISDAVNLASRLESLTKNYGVALLIGENTLNSLSDRNKFSIRFIDRVMVKGKTQPQSIFEVYDYDKDEIKRLKTETKPIFEEALAYFHYKEIDLAIQLLEKCLALNPDDKPAQMYLKRCEDFIKTGTHDGAQELSRNIIWDDSFKIGHEEIDNQHYQLLSNSYKLKNSIEKNVGKSEIIRLVAFLDDYAVHHFSTEEKLMKDRNYPFLERQKKQHLSFIRSFEYLKKEIFTPGISKIYLMFRVQIFLVDWILNHTLKEDQHFAKYMLNSVAEN
jgi:hemerythrin